MKITPANNYRKPLYAVGVLAALAAVSVTGCTDPFNVKHAGDVPIQIEETRETVKGRKTEQSEPVALAGDVAVCTDETYDLILEGEATVDPDWTEPTEEDFGGPVLDGGVSIDEPG